MYLIDSERLVVIESELCLKTKEIEREEYSRGILPLDSLAQPES